MTSYSALIFVEFQNKHLVKESMLHIEGDLGYDVSVKVENQRYCLVLFRLHWSSHETGKEVRHFTIVPEIKIKLVNIREGSCREE